MPFYYSQSFFSCKEKFNPNEFRGIWIPLDNKGAYANLPSITFQNDSLYLHDIYTYNSFASYKIRSKSIEFFVKNDTLKYDFNFSRKDSILKINNNDYMFMEGYHDGIEIVNYDLINLRINQPISPDSLSNYQSAFHIFRDKKGILKLKLNDKTTSDFNLLPSFAFQKHRQVKNIVIYIGENITLREIVKCYFLLYQVNINQVFLLTDFDIKNNTYYGFLDNFEFWQNQINELSTEKIEPIITIIENQKKKYLKKYSVQTILVNQFDEKSNISLDTIDKTGNYLIKINSEMSLEKYILLKEKIFMIENKEGIKIRTEFINL
jgi:hypothetical protein